jgi:peptide/nickel transport system ATP-binding protein
MMTSNGLLHVEGLRVEFNTYDGCLHVLENVSMSATRNEKVGLVGESGCGKSTLGRCIVRRIRPVGGEISFLSECLGRRTELLSIEKGLWRQVRKEIQMIFQEPGAAINPVFTVGDQLKAAIRFSARTPLGRRQVHNRAVESLQEVQLPDPERIMRSYPFQLSGGMQQRICIAMALGARPSLLIADEPTTALDVTIQEQILRLLNSLVAQQGTAVIFITHSLGVVREISDRVYVMYAGHVVETATSEELFEKPSHPYTRGLITAVPKLTGGGIVEGIPGKIPSYLDPPSGCRFRTRCAEAMPRCRELCPPIVSIAATHEVACFLYTEDPDER